MLTPAKNRTPTPNEVERLRLVLSTYQDGTGMLALEDGTTLPGWRDFERAVALAFHGESQESKFIFDVLLPDTKSSRTKIGLSCKMRRELNRLRKDGRATLELSTSAGKFWDHLNNKGIDQTNYRDTPGEVGIALLEVVQGWYDDVSVESGGIVDLRKSSHLVLLWNRQQEYQLVQFALRLPNARELIWQFPTIMKHGAPVPARRLQGVDEQGTLFEWYGESGGQLKYYPPIESSIWTSEPFKLEPLPKGKHGIEIKVQSYFPELWARVS